MTYRLTSETHDLNEEISTESTSSCNRDISFSSSPFPAGDDYVVRVLFGACMGHSDRFAIARVPPSRIRIFSPDTGDRWLLGTRQRIEWDDGTPTLENRRITLMNGYDEVIPITPGAISFDPSSERFFVAWDVPHELPAGRWAADRFAIRIEEGGGGPGASFTAAGEPAFSGFFSIPGEGVVVEQPTGGTTYYRLNFLPVSWRVIGDPGVSRVNVELYNNEGDVHIPVADNHPIGTPLSSVFLDPDRVSTGERYILQLRRPDGSNLAQSEEFRIANPSIRVTSPHGGGLAVRHGRSMTIAWRTENLPPGTGLRGTAQWVTPYGAIPICEDLDLNRGSFVWQVGLSRCPDVPVGPMPGGTIEGGVRRGSGNFIRLRLNALPEVQDESSPFTVE